MKPAGEVLYNPWFRKARAACALDTSCIISGRIGSRLQIRQQAQTKSAAGNAP